MLQLQFTTCTIILTCSPFLLSLVSSAFSGSYNFTIPLSSTEVVYTPSLCNDSITPHACVGAWQLIDGDGVSLVSTTGPDPAFSNIIPQIFLRFRASALYLTTSPLSNATANITVTSNDRIASATFNSSIGAASIVDITESNTTTVSLTYVLGQHFTVLGVSSLVITVSNVSASTSFLPTGTLPPSVSLTSFVPSSSSQSSSTISSQMSTSLPSGNHKVAEAVGLTVGLGLGLTAFSFLAFLLWRRRRRRRNVGVSEGRDSEKWTR